MKILVLAGLVAAAITVRPAAASDADCGRARDQHADFKAIFDNDPAGKPQYETVQHGSDGMVTVTRWIGSEKRYVRSALHGVFGRTLEVYMGAQSRKIGFSHSIDVAKLFPLHTGQTAEYRVSMAQPQSLEPKFSETKFSVGAAREIAIGGCKLQSLEVVLDSHGAAPSDPASKTTFAYVPALEYAVEIASHVTVRGNARDATTKAKAIEAWSP